MKPYRVEIDITTKYAIEVHAETEIEAIQQAEDLSLSSIEDGGDFIEMVDITVGNVKLLEPEEEEDMVRPTPVIATQKTEEIEVEASEEAVDPAADTVDYPEPVPTSEETGFVKPEPSDTVTLNPDGTIAEPEQEMEPEITHTHQPVTESDIAREQAQQGVKND